MKKTKLTAVLALALGLLLPHQALAWADKGFAYRKAITADARAGGVSEGAKSYPVLVRLDAGQFNFVEAQKSGADIRFYDADDKTPLAYQVESFDPQLGMAMIWVQVPELPAGGQHKIWMYWGNPKAKDASAAQAFDPSFRAVYHFSGADAAQDASAYGSTASKVAQAPASAIGQGASFDGKSGVTLPGSTALALDPAKGFTFQAWVHETQPSAKAVIYARGQGASSLVIGLAQGVPFVEVDGKRAQGSSPIGSDWADLAVAGDGTKTVLYVNGQQAASLDGALPALSGPATLGLDAADPASGFTGQMDEVRLSEGARSAGWLAADYASQRQGAKLLAFGADEKPSGSGFGYFGIIFKNITPDALVVIAILSVMAIISWIVMWAKASYVGSVSRANQAFERAFRELGREDLLALDRRGEVGLDGSALYRIYKTGVAELHSRGDLKGKALTEETVEAIRAALDAQQVDENQKLDRFMVLLTIAISGGPFIGLLGTVLGVMITFAAIAAAGDVNVNAIAPGIAAALMATVAGLGVAIPALFGYNYLSSRNGEVSAKMQVFADRFITRLAEVQRDASNRQTAR